MRWTEEVGPVASTGDVRVAEKVQGQYVAEAAITVGKAVQISTATTYPYGSAVLTAATATDHAICGVFEGETESRGARTAVSGLTGFDAVVGEKVWVTLHGPAILLVLAAATDSTIAAYDGIDFSSSAGRGVKLGTAPLAGNVAATVALEAQTATATAGTATDVYVRYM